MTDLELNGLMDLERRFARARVAFEQRDEQYTALIQLLAKVVSGEIARSRVLVNLTDRTWQYCEEGSKPSMPATINGVPLCIVAPPDPIQDGLDAILAERKLSGDSAA